MQTTSEISHKIRIRYLASVTPKLRIKFGTRYFDIVSVINPDERNEYLEMMCRETTPVRDG
jgi:SPP1 family predicted phage head-tail adaptor